MPRYLLLVIAAACGGCATPQGTAPAPRASAQEVRRHCVNRMYADRIGRGRSAVNWHIYDQCMARQPSGS